MSGSVLSRIVSQPRIVVSRRCIAFLDTVRMTFFSEHLAHELKIDSDVIRRVNLTQEGDMLHYGDFPVEGTV